MAGYRSTPGGPEVQIASAVYTNATGVLTITETDGSIFNVTIPFSALVDNGDSTFTFTNEAGTAVTFDVCGAIVANCDNAISYNPATQTLSFVNHDGTTTNLVLTQLASVETPAGVAYPDPDADGIPQVGVEDNAGVPYPFDAASGEWDVQQVYRMAAGGDPNGLFGDPTVNHGIAYDEDGRTWIWNETAATWQIVRRDYRDHLIEQGPISGAATDLFTAHIDAALFTGPGIIDQLHVSAFDNGLDGDVTIEVAADNGGTIIGTATLVSSGGQMITMSTLGAPVAIAGAGDHTFTYRISATTATVGSIEDVDIVLDFRY